MAKEYNTRDERVESPAEIEQQSDKLVGRIKNRKRDSKKDK